MDQAYLLLAFLLGELVKHHDMQSFHQNNVAAAESDDAHLLISNNPARLSIIFI